MKKQSFHYVNFLCMVNSQIQETTKKKLQRVAWLWTLKKKKKKSGIKKHAILPKSCSVVLLFQPQVKHCFETTLILRAECVSLDKQVCVCVYIFFIEADMA